MRIGFGRQDITPRVGVELCGFGPFRCRHSVAVRDRLWARAMALEHEGRRVVLLACDLIGVPLAITDAVRARVQEQSGLPPESLMLCCSHTHSGPAVGTYRGWGEADPPYCETLPARLAQAVLRALADLADGSLYYGEAPCEGIGLNREYDRDAPPLEEVLQDTWRPAHPERTDTVCRVLEVRGADGRRRGFVSHFGCHPVTCCAATRAIHGDYCGVATNLLEREEPGSTGLFVQGAQGDVNSCVVHKPEPESLLALDVVAGRYARAVRQALSAAVPMPVAGLACVRERLVFTRKPWGAEELRRRLRECEAFLHRPDAHDDFAEGSRNVRMETVYALSLRALLGRLERGEDLATATEVMGLRLGPLTILGSGFETMQAIKNDVVAGARGPHTWVSSLTNDSTGYAPDRDVAARGGYAADMVPLIIGTVPYAGIHDELVAALLRLDRALE
ncbi:MAG: hypothetical protein GX595_15730 [Lentisphaerae bacterium]|nr:hypothetical protein [Lentisphaerota bacterium]